MPEWLNNSAIVNLVLIILAFASLVFEIVNSDRSVSFFRKCLVFLGRCTVGILVIAIKVFLSQVIIDLLQSDLELTLIWQRHFSNSALFGILIMAPGILTTLFASTGVNRMEVVKRSVVSVIITTTAVNILTSNIVLSFQWLIVELLTSTIAGLIIAFLLGVLGLWTYRGGFSI
ncbi:MAG: hypothetical protein ACOYZ8_19605 [Chloroflexota bacterium]